MTKISSDDTVAARAVSQSVRFARMSDFKFLLVWFLLACACTAAIWNAAFLALLYWHGLWIVNSAGAPLYTDFTTMWVAATQALRGDTAALYDPAVFIKIQEALVGHHNYLFPHWPYPPTYFLYLAPLGFLPYKFAFVCWVALTLLCLLTIVCLIVRRTPAVAL